MIYTFYSYKGGVGRSMALANVAEWFYQQGLRVVIIDWDLEAPGLESFFVSQEEIEKVRSKPGLIDMLLAYREQYPLLPLTVSPKPEAMAAAGGMHAGSGTSTTLNQDHTDATVYLQTSATLTLGEGSAITIKRSRALQKLNTRDAVEVLTQNLPPLEYFLFPLRPKKDNNQGGKQALWLLSAGWRSKGRFSEYGREVQNFSWSDFYNAFHGEAYFEWMRRQLTDSELADVILIDSRTGLTEMGGVSTRQLADVVVSFTAPNIQNLSGVAAMTASFEKKEVLEARNALEPNGSKRPLEVIVVPTRVENSELTERKIFKEEFTKLFNEFPASFRILKKTFWDLVIPYIPKYAYREKLAIGDEEAEVLQEAYKVLAAHLVLLAPEGSALRARFADELKRIFPGMLPRVLLLGGEEHETVDPLRRQLQDAGLSLWDNTNGGSDRDTAQPGANVDLAEFLVLPVTREKVRSETFQKHWRHARQQAVCVVLVKGKFEDSLTTDDLPAWLRDAHIYDPVTEIERLIELLRRPCITSRVPFMIPELPDSYVDRPAEFTQLRSALLNLPLEPNQTRSDVSTQGTAPGSDEVTRVVLYGPAGSGKTVLATAACIDEKVIATYPDGMLWVTLGHGPDIPARLGQLFSAVTGQSQALPATELELLLNNKLSGKKCLLVINDVCSESDLQPFLGIVSTGAVIITSRNQNLSTHLDTKRIVIGEITPAQSVELLTKISRISPNGDEKTLNRIVDAMGYYPLAIKLAAITLRQRLSQGDKSDVALKDLYQEIQERGVVAFDQKNTTDHNDAVAKSIGLSLNSLSDQERDFFLKLSVVKERTAASINELAGLWEVDEAQAISLVNRFASLSLLDYDAGTKTIRLNRLVESFLKAHVVDPSLVSAGIEKAESVFAILTPEEQRFTQRIFERLVRVASPDGKLPDTRRSLDLEKFESGLRPVIETLRKAELLTIEEGALGGRSPVQIADDSLVQSWPRLRNWLDADRQFLGWRQTLEPKIVEWESSKRHNREVLLKGKELAASRQWVAKREADLNESEKRFIDESTRVVVQERRRRIGLAIMITGLALLMIGIFLQYWARTQQQQAFAALSQTRIDPNITLRAEPVDEETYNEAIKGYSKIIDENPKFAPAFEGRARIYTVLGDYEKAANDYEAAIALTPDYAGIWKDLGIVYRLWGDKSPPNNPYYDESIKKFSQALVLEPDYIDAYSGRADTYLSKGDRGDKPSYDLAIYDYTRVIALRSPGQLTADVYYKRGLAYKGKADYAKALADFQKASGLPADDITRENIKRNLQQLKGTELNGSDSGTPKIFIRYNDPDDQDSILQLAQDLNAADFNVVGQPQVSAGSAYGDGDVRCFNLADAENAEKIASLVQKSLHKQNYFKTIVSRPLGDYPNVPLGQIEVWIAPLRISKPPPTAPTR